MSSNHKSRYAIVGTGGLAQDGLHAFPIRLDLGVGVEGRGAPDRCVEARGEQAGGEQGGGEGGDHGGGRGAFRGARA